MLKTDIKIQGIERVIKKIDLISKTLNSNDLKEYLAEKMLKVVNRLSEERLSKNENYIEHNKYKIEEKYIVVYNDVENDSHEHYSLILEYGSGIYAEGETMGSTPTFKATGGMYWYVPESEAPDLFDYPYERVVTEDGEVLYKVFGQTPKYIYEDSAKVVERNVARWVREYIKEKFGDVK